jgi:precorrin-2 dehydrogenase/sirohydrochlorin ferrochelatase
MDMNKQKVLLVGGGTIALQKLEKLLDFTTDITIISIDTTPQLETLAKKHKLPIIAKAYQQGDIDGFDIVIVATNTVELHKEIYKESRDKRVLVNSVDDTAYCDFIFPSYIKQEDLIISFSTSGASPAFAKSIKEYIQNKIPANTGEFLAKMKALRTQMPKGKARMEYFKSLVDEYFQKNFKN